MFISILPTHKLCLWLKKTKTYVSLEPRIRIHNQKDLYVIIENISLRRPCYYCIFHTGLSPNKNTLFSDCLTVEYFCNISNKHIWLKVESPFFINMLETMSGNHNSVDTSTSASVSPSCCGVVYLVVNLVQHFHIWGYLNNVWKVQRLDWLIFI